MEKQKTKVEKRLDFAKETELVLIEKIKECFIKYQDLTIQKLSQMDEKVVDDLLEIMKSKTNDFTVTKVFSAIEVIEVFEKFLKLEETQDTPLETIRGINEFNKILIKICTSILPAKIAVRIAAITEVCNETALSEEDMVKLVKEERKLNKKRIKAENKVEIEEKSSKAVIIKREPTQEELERAELAKTVNARFGDLCTIRRSLKNTGLSGQLSTTLCTRLDKFHKNYKMPVDASRSFGCLKQANTEIDKMYDTIVEPLREKGTIS